MSRTNTKDKPAARQPGSASRTTPGKRRAKGRQSHRVMLTMLFVLGFGVVVALCGSENPAVFPFPNSGAVAGEAEGQREGVSRPAVTGQKGTGIRGKLVVIDAGHGGFDCGTTGVSGSHEDDLNLQVAQCLREQLIQGGAQVIMTRENEEAIAPTKDEDMQKRRQIIADSGSDIVVSIHMNSYEDPNTRGHIVYFMQGSVQGQRLAQAIGGSMDQGLDTVRKNNVQSNDYFILKSGTQPCVLVECGFLSNRQEEAKLLDPEYQQKVGEAIFQGIEEYFKA